MDQSQIDMAELAVKRTGELMIERLKNTTMVVAAGTSPIHLLMGEICTLEVKISALMMMMQERGFDFREINRYVALAADDALDTSKRVRTEIIRKESTKRST